MSLCFPAMRARNREKKDTLNEGPNTPQGNVDGMKYLYLTDSDNLISVLN